MTEPGWYAFPPDGWVEDDDSWTGPRKGSLITFMSDVTVDVPLWDEDGELIFDDGEEMVREWRITEELASGIVAWGRASQDQGVPTSTPRLRD